MCLGAGALEAFLIYLADRSFLYELRVLLFATSVRHELTV